MRPPSDGTAQRRDLRLLPVAVGIWIGAAYGLHASGGVGSGVVAIVAVAVMYLRPASRWFVAAICVGALMAILRVSAANPAVVAGVVDGAGRVRVELVVHEEPRRRDRIGFGGLAVEPTWSFRGTLITVDTGERLIHTSVPVTAVGSDVIADTEVGSTLHATALLHPDDPARRSTYRVSILAVPQRPSPPSRGSRLATAVRNALADVIHADRPAARAGATLLPGLVLGDTRAQSPELVEDLRTSGLSHLTAVSGANVAIVLGAVLWLLQHTRVRRRLRYLLLLGILIAFVVVVQPQPSVMRAAVMGAISVYAIATGAARQSSAVLWLSVIVLLIVDPFMAWQYGFALSVAATAGLILMQPWLAERLPDRRWVGWLLVTLSAQITTLPILMLMGQPPTWLSIPANVVSAPLVAPATVSGFIAALLSAFSLLPMIGDVVRPLAECSALPGILLADVIARVAAVGARSDFAVSPFARPATAVAFCVLVAVAWRLRHRWVLAGTLLLVFVIVTSVPRPGGWPPSDWWFAVCDVGQGDASVVRTREHAAVVIDVGPDAAAIRRCLRRLDVQRVDVLVLTHFHADHVEGIRGLLDVAEVGQVLRSPSTEPVMEYQRTAAVLRRPMQVIQQGDRMHVNGISFDVLWPTSQHLSGDPNTDSVVLLVRSPRGRILLGADANTEAQIRFASPVVDVLKVPHHGSRYQSADFLSSTHARLAIVSVGAGNDYGHPATGTMGILRAMGAVALRTDRVGSVAVGGNGLSVATER